jgi:hypothetical protein
MLTCTSVSPSNPAYMEFQKIPSTAGNPHSWQSTQLVLAWKGNFVLGGEPSFPVNLVRLVKGSCLLDSRLS